MTRPTSPIDSTTEQWTNWSRSEPAGPTRKFTPKNIAELVEIAKNAGPAFRVKASGSRWSSSAAARAENAWVDTSALDRVLNWDLSTLADELWAGGNAGELVLVQAGIKIHALATALWDKELSIPTLGGSMGQSIAGAISTGTHGTDIDLPPIAAMVRAIHLVAPGGNEYWLEHPDRPIASAASLKSNYGDWHDSIKVRRDADMFNAALVSVGRCGFIYAYVLEAVTRFQLRSERGRSTWQDVRSHLQRAAGSGNWRQFIRNTALPFNESTKVRSSGTPAPISVDGRLSVLWVGTRGPGQFRWIHQRPGSNSWTRKRIVDDGRVRSSHHAPAVAFFKGRYYLAWTGTRPDHPYIHLIRSTDATGAYWEDHIRFDGRHPNIPEAKSSEGPSLLAANGKLHIVWVGTNKPGNFRWITSTDGTAWGDKRVLTDPARVRESYHRPALAFFGNRYYLAWTGTNSAHPHVHMIRSTNASGTSWGDHLRFDGGSSTRPDAMSRDAPTLLSANGKLHVVWVGTNQPGRFRWITSTNGTTWQDKRILADAGQGRQSNHAPAITYHNGRYYLFWVGYGSEQNVHVLRSTSASGSAWVDHARLWVPPGPSANLQDMRSLDVALSPFSANGHAWWTIRTPVSVDQTATRREPERSPAEQQHLVKALAAALQPGTGAAAGGFGGFFAGLVIGGPLGAIIGGISGAIAGGVAADSDDVFATITDLVFAMELNSPDTTGPNFEITSGTAEGFTGYEQRFREFWDDAPKAQYTEVFFDAERTDYLSFVDAMLAYFHGSPAKHAGYIAIRFMGPCEAPLAMQRWSVTAAVEVALLEALDPQAKQTIEAVNRLAEGYDVRFHWGMTRPLHYRPPGLRNELEQWKSAAERLNVEAGDGMSSEFSRATGLEPDGRKRADALLMWGAAS